ncbi:7TMR-DISMED2 domain-containing protein [Pseudoalteromonas maricaloris]|uniref:7TMR-DISMED2 domain-containing protein n=1 Tax=Pseudoalteromonas maricaloris TaxID=184924 RepID=UPI003C22FFE5
MFVLLLSLCSQVVAAGKETLQLEYVASNAKIVDVINNPSIHWQTTDDKVLNLGYSNLSYWVRTSLNTDEKEGPYLLEIAYPVLDQLDVYMLKEGNIFVHQQLGDKQPFIGSPHWCNSCL